MSRFKWYKRDPLAALDGMMILTLEERGAYNTLLDLIYAREGKVDDDDRFLAGWMRCDVRVWKRIKERLIKLGKIQSSGGVLTNLRATSELSEAVSLSELNRANANKRWSGHSENKNLDDATAVRGHMPITIRETRTIREKEDSKENPIQKNEASPPATPGRPPIVFESGIIRLNQADFDKWEAAFPHLDLKAELIAITDWANEQGKKNWFFAVPKALKNANQKAKERMQQAQRAATTESDNPWHRSV